MARYIGTRLLIAIPTIIGVSIIVFAVVYLLPGDAVDSMLSQYAASSEDIAHLREAYGLNHPFYVQYYDFAKGAIHGDLGRSIFTDQPVTTEVLQQLPATLQLAFASVLISIVLGSTMGIVAAINQNSWLDTISMFIALFGVSMPSFWIGLIAIYVFALDLGWFPVAGTGGLDHLILPASVLGFGGAGIIARMTRSSMLETLRQDFVTTARAKGLVERRVVFLHALRNALIPVVTVIGFQVGYAVGGAVVVETVFGRQGIGQISVAAIENHDIPLIQGVVLLTAIALVLTNLAVDVCYAFLDPRIRYS